MIAAAQPDHAETVRLLPADTFTQQTREEWIEVAAPVLCELRGATWASCGFHDRHRMEAAVVVDALLANLATQQARPMPGGGGQ